MTARGEISSVTARSLKPPSICVRPFPGPLGAEIDCGDLRYVDSVATRQIHQAWLDHLFVVFHNQKLTNEDLLAVTQIFGEPEEAAVAPKEGVYQDVAIVSNVVENGKAIGVLGAGELLWHSDHSFHEEPLAAALLYAVEVPGEGGDTHFSNMYLALERLPADLKKRIVGLTIKNDGSLNSAGIPRTDAVITDLRTYEGPSHPIIRTHPETEHNGLYLGRRPNAYINGLSIEESEDLLDELWAHATQPCFAWAHRWDVGDLVVWDNRCVMHRRDSFHADVRRIMHRTQCSGDRPVHRVGTANVEPHPRSML